MTITRTRLVIALVSVFLAGIFIGASLTSMSYRVTMKPMPNFKSVYQPEK